jgi:hypothetical protein
VLRRRGAISQVLEVERLLVDEERGFATRGGQELDSSCDCRPL